LGDGVEGFNREEAKKLLAPIESKLKESVMMRSDYSRNMDKLTKQQKEVEEGVKWLEQQKAVDYNNKAYVEQLLKQLEDGAKADPNPASNIDTSKFLTPEQLQEVLAKRETELQKSALGVMAKTVDVATKFQEEFGKRLDINEVYSKAQSEGKSLDVLYDEYAKPLREERNKKEFEAALEKAKKEGYEQGLSRAYNPDPASSPKSSAMTVLSRKPEDSLPNTTKEGRRQIALKALQEAQQRR